MSVSQKKTYAKSYVFGCTLASKAVELDLAKKYTEALSNYEQGIEALLAGAASDQNADRKEQVHAKLKLYRKRVDELRAIIAAEKAASARTPPRPPDARRPSSHPRNRTPSLGSVKGTLLARASQAFKDGELTQIEKVRAKEVILADNNTIKSWGQVLERCQGKGKQQEAAKPQGQGGFCVSKPTNVIHETGLSFDPKNSRIIVTHGEVPDNLKDEMNKQFGVPPQSIPRVAVEGYQSPIPAVLQMLKQLLVKLGGLQAEGVFRKAPSADQNDDILAQINKGQFDSESFEGDPMVLANLIKVWFRSQPAGYKLFEAVDKNNILTADMFGDMQAAEKLMSEMPEPHRSLMLWLLDIMVEVLDYKDVNRMSVRALAVVIAPNLFNFDLKGADPLAALTFSQKAVIMLQKCLKWRLATVRPDCDLSSM